MLIAKFYRLPIKEKKLFFQALVYSIFFRLVVVFTPFRVWYKMLGKQHFESVMDPINDQVQMVQLVKRASRRSQVYLPFKEKCLIEAMVAKKLLIKSGIQSTIFLGVNKDQNKSLIAHAWLKCGSAIITGNKGKDRYTVLEWFS